MFHLVYTSVASHPFTGGALAELLRQCREKNVYQGITGLLLYKRGAFMQALEGEEAAVRSLYAVIGKDPRHRDVLTLLAVPVNERLFSEWSMGFKNFEETMAVTSVPGYNPDPNLPPFSPHLPWKASVALRLLAGFMRGK